MLKKNTKVAKLVAEKQPRKRVTKKTEEVKPDNSDVKIIKSKAEFKRMYPNIKIK